MKIWDLRTPSVVMEEEVPYSLVKTMNMKEKNAPRGIFKMIKPEFC